MATGYELESTSALGLSLVNFGDDICDPIVSMTDFGGFCGRVGEDGVERAAENVDPDEGQWTDGFDTIFGLREDLWSDWKS